MPAISQARLRETYGRISLKGLSLGTRGQMKIAKHDGIRVPFSSLVHGRLARIDFSRCGETFDVYRGYHSPQLPNGQDMGNVCGNGINGAVGTKDTSYGFGRFTALLSKSLPFHGITAYLQMSMQLPDFDPYITSRVR